MYKVKHTVWAEIVCQMETLSIAHSAPEIKKWQKSDPGVSYMANWPLGMRYQHLISQKLWEVVLFEILRFKNLKFEKSNIQRLNIFAQIFLEIFNAL